jgi:glycosyltransferase involved in cell wall biosynthesis
MKTSVIIRNKNEAEYIGFAIQSVIDYIPNSEIIIVDNHSTDDSMSVVKLFNNICNIKIIQISDYTPGKSLNLGVKSSSNDTILVLSAHSQICKIDLNELSNNLNTHSAVFGKQIPIYRGKKINKRYIWSHFIDTPVINMFSSIESRPFLHNAFCFYKKETLEKYPFDEELPGKEDRYWAKSIIDDNKTYLYSPSIEVNHYYTTNGATWKGIG